MGRKCFSLALKCLRILFVFITLYITSACAAHVLYARENEAEEEKRENKAVTASELQLSSSQITATTGDSVKFTIELPSSISGIYRM